MKLGTACVPPDTRSKLQNFRAEGLDVELFAVSSADAAAEAFSNQNNQVYFGKGQISLREGAWRFGPRTDTDGARAELMSNWIRTYIACFVHRF
jgi:hypothetical protein